VIVMAQNDDDPTSTPPPGPGWDQFFDDPSLRLPDDFEIPSDPPPEVRPTMDGLFDSSDD
jgi:hypothetical protein